MSNQTLQPEQDATNLALAVLAINLRELAEPLAAPERARLTAENQELRRRHTGLIEAAFGGAIPAADPRRRVTVSELAEGIGQSPYTTRKLLERGAIPGARRTTPGVPNSPWLIPAGAHTAYLAEHGI